MLTYPYPYPNVGSLTYVNVGKKTKKDLIIKVFFNVLCPLFNGPDIGLF